MAVAALEEFAVAAAGDEKVPGREAGLTCGG